MNELANTTHGRLLSLAITIALIAGGIAATMGSTVPATIQNPVALTLLGIAWIGSVGLSLIAVALSTVSRPAFGFYCAIFLPFALFLYAVGLLLSINSQATWGAYSFIALGALVGINGLRGLLSSQESESESESEARSGETAHAH